MWGFLDEFWDSIASSTISAGVYSIDWFENIGLAVAGAVGNLFSSLLHSLNDLFVFLGWFFVLIKNLIDIFLLPLTFIFTFLKAFFNSAFSAPIDFTGVSWDSGVLAIFQSLPLWNELMAVLVAGISIILLFFILRQFRAL